MSRGAILQNTSSAGALSVTGQNILDPERSSIVQRGIYQRVQESDGRNWLYYQLFLRQDFDACNISLATCEEPNSPVQGTYGIFMKGLLRDEYLNQHANFLVFAGLIAKRQGKLSEALGFMKTCYARDPRNLEVLRELISLSFLTCSYRQALTYVQLAKAVQPSEDWFLAHHQGLCYERLEETDLVICNQNVQIDGFYRIVFLQAEEHFKSAINVQPQEKSYLELADFYLRHENKDKALDLLERAKRFQIYLLSFVAYFGCSLCGLQSFSR